MIGAPMKLQRTVDDIAALLSGTVQGDGSRVLDAVVGPDLATSDSLVPVYRREWLEEAVASGAACLLVDREVEVPEGFAGTLIRVDDPDRALDELGARVVPDHLWPGAGVHASAVVDPTAQVDASARIGARAVVGPAARIAADVVVHPGVIVGAGVVVGEGSELRAGAILEEGCVLGRRVIVHAGALIGSDGFGYRFVDGRHEKIPQRGGVVLGDDVEVGSGTTIDRARFDATVVGAGTKIDSQVHVAHNCRIGARCALAGHSTLAGHVVVEDDVLIGGRVGIANGVRLARGTSVAGYSMVLKDTEPKQYVAGIPARAGRRWAREVAAVARLPEWMKAREAER